MDSELREILRTHEYNRLNLGCYGCNWSFDDMEDGNSWDQYLAHIESLESQQPNARGAGLPPQRSMTPEEVAGMKAYRETKFQRVAAQDDGLREEVPIIHGRAELAAHDAALKASVREETLDAVIPAIIKWLSENPKWPIMSRLNSSLRKAAEASSLASEKDAPEEVTQASEELGVCNHFPQGPPHRRRNHSNNTNFPCVNWRPLPKGDAK